MLDMVRASMAAVDGGDGHAEVQRDLRGPFARAFLSGLVKNEFDKRHVRLRIDDAEDLAR